MHTAPVILLVQHTDLGKDPEFVITTMRISFIYIIIKKL